MSEKDFTIKQRKWTKKYIETGNATEAAMQVYNCKNRKVAESIGSENLRKLAFPELMEDMGLTDVALINVGAEGLRATKLHGSGDSYAEVEDYAVRHRYWETLLKLKNRLTDKPSVLTQINIGHPSWAK